MPLLQRMVDEEKRATGMVIGMVAPNEKLVVGYGRWNEQSSRAPDASTLFEIGSISKVFIGTLLAESVLRGEVRLDDPASKYLPASVRMPQYNGIPITLLHLATHSSGLPRDMPTSLPGEITEQNWAQKMYDFISTCSLTGAPGERYAYSNLGMTLVAHILELRTGIPYETLLSTRLLKPLGMDSTRITPTEEMLTRLATGHTSTLYPVTDYIYMEPERRYVGGILSNADDMLKFASAAMGLTETPLLAAFQAATQPQQVGGGGTGLAWAISTGSFPFIHHAGDTHGMHAFLGFDPQRKVAAVVFTNAKVPLDDVGPHLLHAKRYPLETFYPRILPTPLLVDAKVLQSYAGQYERDGLILKVSVDGDELLLAIPEQEPLTLIAETQTRFLALQVDASATFLITDGKVTAFQLNQAAASEIYTFRRVGAGQ